MCWRQVAVQKLCSRKAPQMTRLGMRSPACRQPDGVQQMRFHPSGMAHSYDAHWQVATRSPDTRRRRPCRLGTSWHPSERMLPPGIPEFDGRQRPAGEFKLHNLYATRLCRGGRSERAPTCTAVGFNLPRRSWRPMICSSIGPPKSDNCCADC